MSENDGLERIASALRDPDPSVREGALEELDQIDIADALELLANAAESSDADVRETALEAFWWRHAKMIERHDPRTIEPLIRLIRAETDSYRRGVLAYDLWVFSDTAVVPLLLDLLADEDRLNVPWKAIHALGVIGDPRAVSPLIRCLRDPDSRTRAYAAEALERIGTPARDAVLEYRRQEEEQVRLATRALGPYAWRAAQAVMEPESDVEREDEEEEHAVPRPQNAVDFDAARKAVAEGASTGQASFGSDLSPAWLMFAIDVALAALDVAYLADAGCDVTGMRELHELARAVRTLADVPPHRSDWDGVNNVGDSYSWNRFYSGDSPARINVLGGWVNKDDSIGLVDLRFILHRFVRYAAAYSAYCRRPRTTTNTAVGGGMAQARYRILRDLHEAASVELIGAVIDVAEVASAFIELLDRTGAPDDRVWNTLEKMLADVSGLLRAPMMR